MFWFSEVSYFRWKNRKIIGGIYELSRVNGNYKIENIADDVYEMTLKGEGAKYISQPGQFINIKINESLQPYLRRPMSISDYDENTIVIVFKVVGQGTEILKNKQIGDQLDCLIGLGNGFTVQEGKALLIGGGLGTPPLYNLGKN